MKITTQREFEEQVLWSQMPVLAEFRATGCGASAAQEEALRALEQTGAVRVCTVDVAAQPTLAGRFGILATPTMLLFRAGRVTAIAVGVHSFDELIAMLTPKRQRAVQ